MRLAEPLWLALFVLVPLPWLFVRLRPRAAWPTLGGFGKTTRWSARLLGMVPVVLRGLAIGCLAVAIARPQTVAGRTRVAGRGVAIVVALDQSSSMKTEDFPSESGTQSRLEAAKETLARFVTGRADDLMGLVVFANFPDLVSPPTLDQSFLLDLIRSIRTAEPGDDGTNLGDALVVAVDAVHRASPKKKVVVLLTDGRNAPAVPRPTDPLDAARIARKLGVTVHTIAVGKPEVKKPAPGDDSEPDGPDFGLLERVAEAGGGRPFVAADSQSLGQVFGTIDALEKSPVRGEVRTRYREHYGLWAAAALGLIAFERLLSGGSVATAPVSLGWRHLALYLARPESLWLLVLVPIWALRSVKVRAARQRDWVRIGQLGAPCSDGGGWWLLGSAFLVVALAQPRWGTSGRPPLPAGHDVVLVIDVSRSMGAKDAVPDRLGVAVESAESLVKALGAGRGDRAAVVAFAGRGVLRCPLTENLGAVLDTLRTLRPGSVRPGGTDLAAGLNTALGAFDDQDHAEGRSVVLFSDGDDHAGAWTSALPRLAEQAVVVHAVAIGDDQAGHTVPSGSGEASGPVRYHGEVVLSKRVDAPLEAVATATGGAVLRLGLASTDLGTLYRDRIGPVGRSRRSSLSGERAERFSLFLLTGLSFLLLAYRPRRGRLGVGPAWLSVLGLAVVMVGAGPPGKTVASLVAEGRSAYASAQFDAAAEAFRQASLLAPGEPIPLYDTASALFQFGRFDEADRLYQEARSRAGAGLRTKIDYALGNTALALGDLPRAIKHYDDCLSSTVAGPRFDEVRRDAALNRAFVVEHAKRSIAPPDGQGDDPPKPPDSRKPSGNDPDPSSPHSLRVRGRAATALATLPARTVEAREGPAATDPLPKTPVRPATSSPGRWRKSGIPAPGRSRSHRRRAVRRTGRIGRAGFNRPSRARHGRFQPALHVNFRDMSLTTLVRPTALVLVAMIPGVGGVSAGQNERLTVSAEARPRSAYVGQVVDLSVTVEARDGVPKVTPPRIENAETFLGTTETVASKRLATTHFLVLPRRAGTLTIPPVKVEISGKVGRSPPLRIGVARVPSTGRPAAFLGGVGPFELTAKAEPTTLRAGETVEYRVAVTGPGALGMTVAPNLGRLPGGIEVENLPVRVVGEPASRTFSWRLRPTRPRETLLPPVAVAAFDPGSGRYLTKATNAVRLSVRDVPRLNPATVDYGQPPPHVSDQGVRLEAAAVAAFVLVLACGFVGWRLWRKRGPNVGRELRRVLDRIEAAGDGPEIAEVITNGLIDYLKRVADRPGGALTPQEAKEGVARATHLSERLADEAESLVALCDQVRFGTGEVPRNDLRELGRTFFLELLDRDRTKQ